MPRGRKRKARSDSEEEGEQEAEAMLVDDADQSAVTSQDEDDELESAEQEQSVAQRVRRRRVRPSNLVACEGDLLAVATSNFTPPLEAHSRPFVIVEARSDVAKGAGVFEAAILIESTAEGEWTTVAKSRRKVAINKAWAICTVKVQCVGTKKIRIDGVEQRRILQS